MTADNRRGTRNAATRLAFSSPGPWSSWRTKPLHARAIRFMESQCVPRKGFGAGKPLKVAAWQAEWLEEVLVPGIDAAAMTLGRGNGKSTFGGALATWAVFDPAAAGVFGGQPQIPIVATTLRQAKKGVYGAAVGFVRNNPELAGRSIVYSASGDERIVVPGNADGEVFITADDEEALQGLDPMIALIDEVGFISVEAWDALLLACGKRPRSLVLGLGTRSPGNSPNALDHLLEQVATHGRIPGFHLTDYHADAGCDADDRGQWRLANPALDEGYMREDALVTARKLSPEAGFRTFRLNQKTETHAGWLSADGANVWERLRSPYVMVAGAPTWAGVDVSHHHDSTAVAWCQHGPDGRVHVEARIWSPGPGRPIPFDEVENELRELSTQYSLQGASYDPRYMAATAQRLEAEGVLMIEVPQSHARMVPLIGETYRRIVAGSLTDNADPQFTSHVLNAVEFYGEGGFSLSKRKSAQHIDACVAMCLAVGSCDLVAPSAPTVSVYEARGLRVLG